MILIWQILNKYLLYKGIGDNSCEQEWGSPLFLGTLAGMWVGRERKVSSRVAGGYTVMGEVFQLEVQGATVGGRGAAPHQVLVSEGKGKWIHGILHEQELVWKERGGADNCLHPRGKEALL